MTAELTEITKAVQSLVGTAPDGVWGPVTAKAVLHALQGQHSAAATPAPPSAPESPAPAPAGGGAYLDARTLLTIASLIPAARPAFTNFMAEAKPIAATLGCDYVLICGLRTAAQQDALYAQGRTAPGRIVTYAQAGQSRHNSGVAADAGVFAAGRYIDDSNPTLADKVHRACAAVAAKHGLEWGGSWKFQDTPHYQWTGA